MRELGLSNYLHLLGPDCKLDRQALAAIDPRQLRVALEEIGMLPHHVLFTICTLTTGTSYFLLPTSYFLLPTYYLLLTTYYLLLTIEY